MNGGPAVRTAGGGIPGRPEPAAPRRATHGVIGGWASGRGRRRWRGTAAGEGWSGRRSPRRMRRLLRCLMMYVTVCRTRSPGRAAAGVPSRGRTPGAVAAPCAEGTAVRAREARTQGITGGRAASNWSTRRSPRVRAHRRGRSPWSVCNIS